LADADAVEVDALDATGLVRHFVTEAAVVVDYTPPGAAAVALQRLPDPRRTPVAFDILDQCWQCIPTRAGGAFKQGQCRDDGFFAA
jgi:hypothetical protein